MILRNTKFVYLWTSQILSQLTVNMMNFLLLARLFTVTGSSIATSFLWLAYALPAVFFGPIGAAVVDLVSRRKILMVSNLLQALVVFGFIFYYKQSVFLVYLVVLLYSFFNQFYIPAENSSLPSVVKKDDLPQANSMFLLTQQFALVLGMGLAGLVQKLVGFSGSLIVCSLFLFAAFISVAFLPNLKPRKKAPQAIDKFVISFFKSIYEGYLFIKQHKSITVALSFILAIWVALAIITVNLPVIATQMFGISVEFAGILLIVPAGLGAIFSSFVVIRYLKKGIRKKLLIESSLLIASVAMLLFVVTPFSFSPLVVVLLGASFVGFSVPTFTYLQEATPLWLRGRVFGNLWFLVAIVTVFPVLFSGLIIEFLGVRFILVAIAVATFLAYLYSRKNGQSLLINGFDNG